MLLRRHLIFGAAALAAEPVRRVPLGKATDFHFDEKWDKPFLHPIRTPSGKVISRGYPVDPLPGEQRDHEWHRGIWYGHGVINRQDFWREQGRQKTSRLIVEGAPRVKSSGLSATMAMVPPDGKRIGTHSVGYTVSDKGPLRFIDALIQVKADQGVALTFGDTDDGGFAFRLNDDFREDRGARLRNSEGLEGTNQIWGKAARWVDYSTKDAGIAVFDHPTNLRYPTQWHARGYSLCAANPFASKSFSKNKGPDGAYTLDAGKVLTLRYRVVIHDGVIETPAMNALFQKWAKQ